MRITQFLLVVVGSAIIHPSEAHASPVNFGYVSGTMEFHQKQGNYCRTSSQDCDGANYTDGAGGDYDTKVGVAHAWIGIYSVYAGEFVATGYTDADGDYDVYFETSKSMDDIKVYWRPELSGNRIRVLNSSGGTINFWTGTKYDTGCQGGGSCGTISMGTYYWGSSSNPNKNANVYDGVQRVWYTLLKNSSRMLSSFNTVDVLVDKGTSGNGCPTSCAMPGGTRELVWLDTDTATPFSPQGRVMHELGHIASYEANPRGYDAWSYDYDSDPGWSYLTYEYLAVTFEEAFATHVGSLTLYSDGADEPRVCTGSSHCDGSGSYNLESQGTCGGSNWRRPLQAMRYLWDLTDPGDSLNLSFYHLVDTLAAFQPGDDDHEEDEVDVNADGHSPYDFYWNGKYEYSPSYDSYSLWDYNCLSH